MGDFSVRAEAKNNQGARSLGKLLRIRDGKVRAHFLVFLFFQKTIFPSRSSTWEEEETLITLSLRTRPLIWNAMGVNAVTTTCPLTTLRGAPLSTTCYTLSSFMLATWHFPLVPLVCMLTNVRTRSPNCYMQYYTETRKASTIFSTYYVLLCTSTPILHFC